ncbi:argininosuccinate lyase [Varunaivibrio sulfuroxidans]|nr:argininosuccinate lyase [Varunaivibrio sulfuroxidans]WES32229.1 argininosuccinate lyase [Varunaivibrio sulfuroxidans]
MTEGATSSIWGGRFAAGPSALMEAINASIGFDQRLYAQDVAGSKAHCVMLKNQGIIPEDDALKILDGLDRVLDEIEAGEFAFSPALEDIHMNVENRLRELIGDGAGRLHTARSRNDQVATDLRLWVRDTLDGLDGALKGMQRDLIDRAREHHDDVMPGFTHLQAAQPVTLGHYLLAYCEMLGRDRGRIADCRARMNESPLGAAALAGTSFPIDRLDTARRLGFDRPTANSLDSVSDRDFALEFLSLAAIIAVHLSRMAEEFVLWCSAQFNFMRVSDEYSTGSSIMPQKRNPDAAELVRGKAGRVIGDLTSLLVALKGLPLSYGKDMQEDKEPVFDAADTLELCISAMSAMVRTAIFNTERMKKDAGKGFTTATDLADWLVRVLAMPFRDAHHVTGALVKMAEDKGVGLEDLSLGEMQSVAPGITEEIYNVLGVENSVKSRTSHGGTAPENVRRAVDEARRRFLD